MKRLLMASLALLSMQIGMAQDFDYLTFEKSDGTSILLQATGLTLTFSDGNLMASDGTTIPLSSLSKMFFTQTSGIDLPPTATDTVIEGTVNVYTLAGSHVGQFSSHTDASRRLAKGIYVFKDNQGRTLKTVIR